jgi:hypothetical protein
VNTLQLAVAALVSGVVAALLTMAGLALVGPPTETPVDDYNDDLGGWDYPHRADTTRPAGEESQ